MLQSVQDVITIVTNLWVPWEVGSVSEGYPSMQFMTCSTHEGSKLQECDAFYLGK